MIDIDFDLSDPTGRKVTLIVSSAIKHPLAGQSYTVQTAHAVGILKMFRMLGFMVPQDMLDAVTGMSPPDMLADVKDFHAAFSLPIGDARFSPDPADPVRRLRGALLAEETQETNTAKTAADHLDGLVDVIYIALGTAAAYGYDIDEAWRRVHAANMAKLGPGGKPIYRDDGKVLKPADWKAADLSDLVDVSPLSV